LAAQFVLQALPTHAYPVLHGFVPLSAQTPSPEPLHVFADVSVVAPEHVVETHTVPAA
jgi:hypothetical protein